MASETQARETTVSLLQAVMRMLADLSEEEIHALVTGRATLCVHRAEAQLAKRQRTKDRAANLDFSDIGEALSSLGSRQEGEALLEQLSLNKEDLQRLASKLDLPVMRSDSVDRLRSKIIEATIGYRLRSRAILGDSRISPTDREEDGDVTRDVPHSKNLRSQGSMRRK